ncbi:MAG TPA: hypothetical protein EYN18_05615 [Nitrospirales bacterium]|nr:hypothetical protein [Nitrospirales bacterium]HIA13993.1 hypothetical protein [Nitrospirales bacterium]HIB53681.1 hypothetical protein [Nitrospirales bacterium]HIN32788.1 hypothetical protein [Nitrospirales bacterium]HIO21859.1 hypothetical protein [Nitrospirales bacterium]
MPLYEYSCSACGHRFEVIQKFSDKPIKKCEQCSGKVTKLISAPGLSFKGSGWYITDYSNKSKPPDSKEPADTEKESGDKKSGDTPKMDKTAGDSTKSDSSASSSSTSTPSTESSTSESKTSTTTSSSKS